MVFQKLDLTTIQKASPDKLIKVFTPTSNTWEEFMKLAELLFVNEKNAHIAKQIAYSVGIQIATEKSKDLKNPGIQKYDWVDAFKCWDKYGIEWGAIEMLTNVQARCKGSSLIVDTLISLSHESTNYSQKTLKLLEWLNSPIALYKPSSEIDS